MELTERELTTLWLGAVRYYLGSTTYAVSDFCDLLRGRWPELPSSVHAILRLNIEQAFERDDAERKAGQDEHRALGMDRDRAEWEKLRELWKGL